MKKYCLIIALLLYSAGGFAQAITIGEKCPDILLKNIYNYPKKEMKLSGFNADLIILDMWGYYCEACIKALPTIDSLQKKFAGRLQFIAVNIESEAATKAFFAKRKAIQMPGVPFVSGDTVLSKLFPRAFVPWHVWLDKNLVVQYITFGSNATEEHIAAFLSGNKPDLYGLENLPTKKDSLNSLRDFFYYSTITQTVPGANRNNDYGVIKNNRFFLTEEGAKITGLAQTAMEGLHNIKFKPVDTVILEVKQPEKFRRPASVSTTTWDQQHKYNYYLMLPQERKDKAYEYMLTDIQRYFNITITMEKRMVNHYVLIRLDTIDRIKTKGGVKADSLMISSVKHPVDSKNRYMINCPFAAFSRRWQAWVEGILQQPFKDETGYEGNIDVVVDAALIDTHTYDGFKKALNRLGFDLVYATREKTVLVIKDN
ncbi:TlpA family protein disulfide reductase [Lacibacter luteus]|uniref:TlpA family protein disulfide reductase n=1 Tax=Lacibacter luteus TaxID=2508719 RepID=A0A4Q1CGA3_9BACT|nr:TlpA disulfide reductase family protein [Lacibacter luteus]RXK58851.1 TlpA family protein disulfide reductase [Lacibacter luteus]